jgi:sulfite exporter TauE/SafE
MSLFLTLLPIYLFGNLHCLGMCGPLVVMLGQHKYKYYYYLGRTLSFSMAGALAGGAGAVLTLFLKKYQVPALASFFLGTFTIILGFYCLWGWHYPGRERLAKLLGGFNRSLSLLILRDQRFPTFLFGFLTIVLPCGQTLIVFSACAISGELWTGLWNGLAFALLTSPSLLIAMHAYNLFKSITPYYNKVVGVSAVFVGTLALCRGFADMDLISHLILNPSASAEYHIVIY